MSKRRRMPKQAASAAPPGPGGEKPLRLSGGHRWVAKTAARQQEDDLEAFRSEWQPLPSLDSVCSTDYYFNSYAHFGIHEDMLKDAVRTGSYMRAIVSNRKLFEGKTVLDIGSGTGILCLFAAKAGARKCFGVECSDIVHYATSIAERNGYGDTITYIHGKVEEIELPVPKVDIIVSEWMGYFLIYESMLDSVLFARDRWLADDGLLFPDHATLHLAAMEDAEYREEKIGFWRHVWGLNLSPLMQCAIQEPISDTVDERALATTTSRILELDLRTATKKDLDFVAEFELKCTKKDFLHAMVVWFEVSFRACSPPVVMTTAPGRPYTHWKQTVLYLDEALVAHKGDVFSGMIAVQKCSKNPRDLDLKLAYQLQGDHGVPERTQFFRLR